MKMNFLQKYIDLKRWNVKGIFLILRQKKIWIALSLNAVLAGVTLSTYIENNLLIAKASYEPVRFNSYDGKSGQKPYTYFKDSTIYNAFTPLQKIPKKQPKKKKTPNYLLELHKIQNNLELRGTILLGSINFAVLYHKKQRVEKSFQEGNKIFTTNVTLQKVKRDNVVLAFRGHSSKLAIYKTDNSKNIIVPVQPSKKKKKLVAEKKQPKKRSNQKAQARHNSSNNKKVLTDLKNEIAKEQYLGNFNFNQKDAIKIQDDNINVKKEYFEGALHNLPVMLSHARAVPYNKNNEFLGYQLANVLKGGIFDKLGLKQGDIITSVNGEKVKDLSQVMQFFSVLKNEKYIAVDLLRDSNVFTINYSLI